MPVLLNIRPRNPSQMAQKQGPTFFKVMVPGFSEKLSIPRAFLKYLVGEKCDNAILKSPCGKSWHVKVHGGKEGMRFEEGWLDFVQEHDLQVGEFLVFKYDGDMVFSVIIYDTSCCEKELPLVKKDSRHSTDPGKQRGNIRSGHAVKCPNEKKEGVDGVSSFKAKHPHFTRTIVPSNLNRRMPYLCIPRKFQRANGLSEKRKTTLTDPKGRSWPMQVERLSTGVYCFKTGWSEFSVMNELQEGDVCLFELTNARKKLMDVRIFRPYRC